MCILYEYCMNEQCVCVYCVTVMSCLQRGIILPNTPLAILSQWASSCRDLGGTPFCTPLLFLGCMAVQYIASVVYYCILLWLTCVKQWPGQENFSSITLGVSLWPRLNSQSCPGTNWWIQEGTKSWGTCGDAQWAGTCPCCAVLQGASLMSSHLPD